MMPWSALLEDACWFFERHLTDTHRDHLRCSGCGLRWTAATLDPAACPACGRREGTRWQEQTICPCLSRVRPAGRDKTKQIGHL